jgi:predicted RNase H-like HicB family nuclease
VRTYTIVLEPEEAGGYIVSVPALSGCFTRGNTIDECNERASEAIEVHIAGLKADGDSVPEEIGSAHRHPPWSMSRLGERALDGRHFRT